MFLKYYLACTQGNYNCNQQCNVFNVWAISSIDTRTAKTLEDRIQCFNTSERTEKRGGRKIDRDGNLNRYSLAAARATMNKWRDTSRMACQGNVGLLAISQASTEARLARGFSSKASLWGHARSASSCHLRVNCITQVAGCCCIRRTQQLDHRYVAIEFLWRVSDSQVQ